MTTHAMQFARSPLNVLRDDTDDDRARGFSHARLPLQDQADVALSYAAVPRPAGSSLMPLRRAPRRPDLASGEGVRACRSNYSIQSSRINVCLQPQQSDPIRCRGGIGAWRSEIKGELTVIDRRGGHSRSYAPVPLRLVQPSSEVFNSTDDIRHQASSDKYQG